MQKLENSFSFPKLLIPRWSICLGLMGNFPLALQAQPASQDKPNIVFIITDEHDGKIMGCMGDPYVHTPNLDALAESGILFQSHYCASPISGPSRQSLTTGKYVSHHNVWGNTVGCPNNVPSLPRVLQEQGYETVLTGGMKYNGLNYGWSTYKAGKGYAPAKDKQKKAGSDIPHERQRIKAGEFKDNGTTIGKEFRNMGATDMSKYVDITRTADALAYIKERANIEQPFCLLVGLMAPHYPLQSTPELVAKYEDKIPMPGIPDGYLETLPLNYKHLRNSRQLERVPADTVKLARECYYARVEWMDGQVGQIVDAIRQSPFADNTIIIYTSDHGENLGEHGLWWKNCVYDCAARVPLIVSAPQRWKGGQIRSKATESVDLVQTIVDLGGGKAPADWDGQSMVPFLDNDAYPWKDFAICEYYAGYMPSGITMYRKGDWKYVYHARADETYGPEVELYNMKEDPKELNNLAKETRYVDLIQKLHTEMIEHIGEDPENVEKRYRAGAIPESPMGVLCDYPPYLYEEFRKTPSPINRVRVKLNPTELQWPSVKVWENRDAIYHVYLSQDSLFAEGNTIQGKNLSYCFFNPHKALKPGVWYWKYEIVDRKSKQMETKGVYSFVVEPETEKFETPTFEEFLSNVKSKHPRVMNQGNDLAKIRENAPKHTAYRVIMQKGEEALNAEIYRGPVSDEKDQANGKRLQGVTGTEIKRFHDLLEAYVLSGNSDFYYALLKRIEVLLTWPTDDLLGSQVMTALSLSYDALYDELPVKVRADMLKCVEKQMKWGLARWPGKTEARQIDNHFWQMELSGNFCAALATVGESEVAKQMLEYTYELFIARFPNLSTKSDGGWAEGMGYFNVNKSCVVDMAVWLKKIGNFNVFQMPWYRNLADYYTYFAPVASQVSGFGDMHDRVKDGTGQGLPATLILVNECGYPSANYRLYAQAQTQKAPVLYLSKVEPWYQMVNDVHIDLQKMRLPDDLPNDKVFYATGEAAMHSSITESSNATSVFFRSSPFGAKGHMHANQNCFNIARKGERLFYSTGYYTSFADPHSMTSYRHTRAHNSILVNGCGQAFGHEGYGFIKRFLSGKDLAYVCGDATAAYRPTVDKQFLGMNASNGVKETVEFGIGDGKLKLFERHLVFLRPDIVVVYDLLESQQECDWTFLLHTMKGQKPHIEGDILRVVTERNSACVNLFGSQPLEVSYTDQFFSPAIDFKKKYKEVPNQHHISYKSFGKSKKMRFLAVIQLGDKDSKLVPVKTNQKGELKLGDILIKAEMDTAKPAVMTVETPETTLLVKGTNERREGFTSLKEKGVSQEVICRNQYPEQMGSSVIK